MIIQLLSTGGTIEKIYSELTGKVENLESKIDRFLDRLRLPDTELKAWHLMNKDSLEMTDDDRNEILEAVESLLPKNTPIVITHGTDTMVETGLYLKARLLDLKLPIVFTGAMTPLGFEKTDGLQNLTESLLAARILGAGIWLVMHNQVFPIDGVRKNYDLARFVSVDLKGESTQDSEQRF